MQFQNTANHLYTILQQEETNGEWLEDRIKDILKDQSVKDLFLTYSLIGSKYNNPDSLQIRCKDKNLEKYLTTHNIDRVALARIYMLSTVLDADANFFTPKVVNIIQVADKKELETFLKFLILLPNAEEFKFTAVEALRTNIATVFDAIALNNPYPAIYFNDQQWNQMYLKAAFMQRKLEDISSLEKRSNKELARIISDYAHERWAASRNVDPYFWRPVTHYMQNTLLEDMHRLLESKDLVENRAGALCCYYSNKSDANELLKPYPELKARVAEKAINWDNLKEQKGRP